MAQAGENLATVVVLKPSSATADQLVQALGSNSKVEVIQVDTPTEAVQVAIQQQPCIVIASIPDPKAAVNVITLLKAIYPLAKKGRLKSMVVSAYKNPQIRAAAQKLQVAEYIEEPIPGRTLQFKANLQIKAIDAIKKRDADLKAQGELIEIKQGELAKGKEAYAAEAKLKPMLDIDQDDFTFKGSKVKKQDSRTNFDLGGPDPETGEWKEHPPTEDGKPQWRWVPKDPKELAEIGGADGKDGWVAEGDKPSFDGLKKKWAMGGEAPALGYFKDGKKVAAKVETNAKGQLEVAEDSPKAEEKVRKGMETMLKRAEVIEKEKKEKALKELNEKQAVAKEANEKKKADKMAAREKEKAEKIALAEENTAKATEKAEAKAEAKKAAEKSATEEKKAKRNVGDLSADKLKGMRDRISDDEDEAEAEGPAAKADAKKPKKSGASAGELNDQRETEEEAEAGDSGGLDDLRKRLAEKEKKARDGAGADEDFSKPAKEGESEASGAAAESKADEVGKRVDPEIAAKGAKGAKPVLAEAGANHGKLDHAQSEAEESVAGVLHDKRAERDAAANRDRLEAMKRAIQDDIQAEMNEPIPDVLTPEQRAELEAEVGAAKGELSDKDLARKAKLGRLKSLKKKLADANLELEIADGEEKRGKGGFEKTVEKTEDAGTQSQQQSSFEEVKAKWQGRDSDQDGEDVEWQAHKSKAAESGGKAEADESGREVYYLALGELGTKQPAWEKAGKYFVCVGAETRYRGFQSFAEILPIWVFSGADKPDFLEKDKRWRFYDVAAVQYKTEAELPRDVHDYFLSLNEQVRKDGEEEKEHKEAELELDGKRDKLAALKAKLGDDPEKKEEAEAEIAALEQEVAALEEKQESYKKKKKAPQAEMAAAPAKEEKENTDAADRMAALRAKMVDEERKAAPAEQPSLVDALPGKVKNADAAEFLKKRQERIEAAGPDAPKTAGRSHQNLEEKRAAAAAGAVKTPELRLGDAIAVSLLISDALFDGKNLLENPNKLLKTIAERFGNCRATVLWLAAEGQNKGKVISSSDGKHEANSLLDLLPLPETGPYASLHQVVTNATTKAPLGHILLEPLKPRLEFETSDDLILRAIARVVGDYWTQLNERQKGDKAA